MAALTAAYGVFALARPQHLPDAMNAWGPSATPCWASPGRTACATW
jgi:hypothetical protein